MAYFLGKRVCLGWGLLMQGQTTQLSPILQVTGHSLSTGLTLPLQLLLH